MGSRIVGGWGAGHELRLVLYGIRFAKPHCGPDLRSGPERKKEDLWQLYW